VALNSQPMRCIHRPVGSCSGDKADPLSLHLQYEAAVDSAARAEMAGHSRVVVCFDPSMTKVVGLRKREALASKAEFGWDDAPHYEAEF